MHGLCSAETVFPEVESQADWEAHLAEFQSSMRAKGSVEMHLAERAAAALWKQARVETMQTNLAAMQMETEIEAFEQSHALPKVDPADQDDMNARLWTYEQDENLECPEVQELFLTAFRAAMPGDKSASLLLRYANSFNSQFFRATTLLMKLRDAREALERTLPEPFRAMLDRAAVVRMKSELTPDLVKTLLAGMKIDHLTRLAIDEWLNEHPDDGTAAEPMPSETAAAPAAAAATADDPARAPETQAQSTPDSASCTAPAETPLGSFGNDTLVLVGQGTYGDASSPVSGPAASASAASTGQSTQVGVGTGLADTEFGFPPSPQAPAPQVSTIARPPTQGLHPS